MSIYATLWEFKLPHRHFLDEEWVSVCGQAVPAHIGHPSCYPEGDPYAYFLPPVVKEYNPETSEAPYYRAVVIVMEGRDKKEGQRYIEPLLVLTGEEYARLTFQELFDRIEAAMPWDRDVVGWKREQNGKMTLIRRSDENQKVVCEPKGS